MLMHVKKCERMHEVSYRSPPLPLPKIPVAQLVDTLCCKPGGVRLPMVQLAFFIDMILPAAVMALRST
jgi:hypothetical protein